MIFRFRCSFLLVVALSGVICGLTWPAFGAGKKFNVRDFGARGDGTHLDTQAIQNALDACGAAGGGIVVFPAGIYLSQPLQLRTHSTLQIDAGAILRATDNPSDFLPPEITWQDILDGSKKGPFTSFISGKDLQNITLCGGGTIDGSGGKWWIPAEAARQRQAGYTLPRPNLISLSRIKHLVVSNLTLLNSPKFHLVPDECENVLIAGVVIRAPQHAANTDAIDPSACEDLIITNCTLDVGDDNVAIKASKKIPGREFASENITVTGCTFLHGHGMSIGSETAGGVRNVTVENCFFANTENGLRIKSDVKRGGLVENIVYRNLTLSNVAPAITFTCYYMNNSSMDASQRPAKSAPPANGPHIPHYRNITVSGVTASCPQSAGLILGLPDDCISNVVFDNVHISATTGMAISNARNVQFKNSTVTVSTGEAIVTKNADVSGLKSGGWVNQGVKP